MDGSVNEAMFKLATLVQPHQWVTMVHHKQCGNLPVSKKEHLELECVLRGDFTGLLTDLQLNFYVFVHPFIPFSISRYPNITIESAFSCALNAACENNSYWTL